jgi:hypothetical protein
MKKGLLLLMFSFALTACSKTEDVYRDGTDGRIAVKNERGVCADINTYESSGYWSQGISYSFKKSERIEESDSRSGFTTTTIKTHYTDIVIDSTYTFSPIPAPIKSNYKASSTKLPHSYKYIEPLKYW